MWKIRTTPTRTYYHNTTFNVASYGEVRVSVICGYLRWKFWYKFIFRNRCLEDCVFAQEKFSFNGKQYRSMKTTRSCGLRGTSVHICFESNAILRQFPTVESVTLCLCRKVYCLSKSKFLGLGNWKLNDTNAASIICAFWRGILSGKHLSQHLIPYWWWGLEWKNVTMVAM